MTILDVLVQAFAVSRTEGRRLIKQGAVTFMPESNMDNKELKEKHTCKCEQPSTTVDYSLEPERPWTRIQEIEHKFRQLHETIPLIHEYSGRLKSFEDRLKDIEKITTLSFIQLLRRRIKNWLDLDDERY